ncbi:NAD(P)/FAD-dependent oxidoreductase [Aquibium sp. A9E412]|uniref:phytoene desaturase family protein n=1 Tax=Aquibium sp. A9E412 TaxID=2976767 RepID=UPI0025AF4007|nr:NAD(P)/FAD-dependent oxidoreductase [Aquibium sp. A9E412]MDN2565068.1 NAD(P)/FAD-dependent oxidoreductase [Aquibium sp. A9E412]
MQKPSEGAAGRYDAIIVGGGHNGLVCAAYLAKAGLKVLVAEARDTLGGPCGTYEFMPGYRCAITNSPGSFEPRIVAELELERYGLRFERADPTVVHAFPGRAFIGWRDRAAVAAQLDAFAPGEAARYQELLGRLETLARHLGVSLYEPARGLAAMARDLPAEQQRLFEQVVMGSLRELLDGALVSDQAKALLGMVALNATLAPPSAPGTAIGLMLRPISMASSPPAAADDPRGVALRGSTGLPVGGMGAIIDAIEAVCLAHGATVLRETRVARVLHDGERANGIVTAAGDSHHAPVVISAINPKTLFGDLVDDRAVGAALRREAAAVPMRGSAFKIALALDGLPQYRGLPDGVGAAAIAGSQFRIAHSLGYIERAVADGLAGMPSQGPIMWGLIPSVTSPGVAPPGRHLMSINVWHAPYTLREGDWSTETERFGRHCIDVLAAFMPDLPARIVDHRFIGPRELEAELGLVGSHITHGDMLPGALIGARPHPAADDYRTPLAGLYLSGAGTWPGGYVTGLPGHNTSRAVLADRQAAHQ